MAFIFTMRSAQSGPGHGPRPSTGTLPAISEDEVDFNPPPLPQRAQGYNASQTGATVHPWSTMNFVKAFERSSNRSPPSYSFTSASLSEDDHDKMPRIREKKQIAKRGGWKRLALLVLIVVLCLVGLVVGLVVGLRNRSKNSCETRHKKLSSLTNLLFQFSIRKFYFRAFDCRKHHLPSRHLWCPDFSRNSQY